MDIDNRFLLQITTNHSILNVYDFGEEIGFMDFLDAKSDDAEPQLICIPKHKFDWIIEAYLNRQLNVTETKQ